MARRIHAVIAEVDAITSPADAFWQLERLAGEYFTHPEAAGHLDVWFRLYERFPEHDDHAFWGVLHGLEAQPNSGDYVVASVRRRPSRFPVLMVNRMLNAGIISVAGADLMGLLEEVASDGQCPAGVRKDASRYLAHQLGKS